MVDEDRPGAFAAFAASIGQEVGPTFAVDTAKGRHWYYRQAGGAPLGNGRGQLAGHGIDIRGGGTGNGGYVVGAGSVHQTGVIYTPADSMAPIPPVPGWLAEALRPMAPPATGRAPRRPASTFGALRGLVRVVLDATPERDRNTRLYWSACRAAELVSAGRVDEATATGLLIDAAARTGLPEAEARRTVASGMRLPPGRRCGRLSRGSAGAASPKRPKRGRSGLHRGQPSGNACSRWRLAITRPRRATRWPYLQRGEQQFKFEGPDAGRSGRPAGGLARAAPWTRPPRLRTTSTSGR